MASASIPLQTTWTKIAAAGQNVIVQNLGGHPVVVTTSAGVPTTSDGIRLDTLDRQSGILAADLYARSDQGGFILLADGLFTAGSGTGNTATTPSNSLLPAISGTAQVGQSLTASTGTWLGSPTTYAYQWKRGGTALSNATASTYAVVAADGGSTLSVTVTATNAAGSANATSASTAAVTIAAASSSPGGGTNNTADHSDPNNAYLAAMAA